MDGAKELGARSYVDAITNGWRTTLAFVAEANGDTVADGAVVAKGCVAADDDAADVLDDEASAKRNFGGEFRAEEANGVELAKLIEKRKRHAQKARLDGVAPTPEAIDEHDPEAVTIPTVIVGLPVFTDVVEHDDSKARVMQQAL